MPQTMLAVLSMVVTTLFAFNQHRSVLSTRLNMIREDMAVRASGVAVDLLDEIGSMPFDEATRDGVVTSASELTSWEQISIYDMSGELSSGDRSTVEAGGVNDLDDFHGSTIERYREVNGESLAFKGHAVVDYISTTDNSTVVHYPTKLKKVTIKVYSTTIARPDTIYLSQLYACGSRCGW